MKFEPKNEQEQQIWLNIKKAAEASKDIINDAHTKIFEKQKQQEIENEEKQKKDYDKDYR